MKLIKNAPNELKPGTVHDVCVMRKHPALPIPPPELIAREVTFETKTELYLDERSMTSESQYRAQQHTDTFAWLIAEAVKKQDNNLSYAVLRNVPDFEQVARAAARQQAEKAASSAAMDAAAAAESAGNEAVMAAGPRRGLSVPTAMVMPALSGGKGRGRGSGSTGGRGGTARVRASTAPIAAASRGGRTSGRADSGMDVDLGHIGRGSTAASALASSLLPGSDAVSEAGSASRSEAAFPRCMPANIDKVSDPLDPRLPGLLALGHPLGRLIAALETRAKNAKQKGDNLLCQQYSQRSALLRASESLSVPRFRKAHVEDQASIINIMLEGGELVRKPQRRIHTESLAASFVALGRFQDAQKAVKFWPVVNSEEYTLMGTFQECTPDNCDSAEEQAIEDKDFMRAWADALNCEGFSELLNDDNRKKELFEFLDDLLTDQETFYEWEIDNEACRISFHVLAELV